MKKPIIFTLIILFFIPGISRAQKENIELCFQPIDNRTEMPVIADSILVRNPVRDCDTVLPKSNPVLVLEWYESIGEHAATQAFTFGNVYPNPYNNTTSGFISLKKGSDIHLFLSDATGKKVASFERYLNRGSYRFEVTTGRPGFWFLTATDGKTNHSVKLINNGKSSSGEFGITLTESGVYDPGYKATRQNTNFFFVPGDSLDYTIYCHGYDVLSFSDAPKADRVYTSFLEPNFIDFSADSTSGYAPLLVQFYGETNMEINSWHWDFGDGSTSGEQNPTHIFDTPDTYYTVTLTVVDGQNITHIINKEGFIHVFHDLAYVNFTADYPSGVSPLTVHFTSYTNIPNPNMWQWDFGDGNTASGVENPYHEYISQGVYTVTLTVYNNNGSKTETKEDYIHVGVCPSTVTDDEGNVYETVRINNQCWMKSNLNIGVRIDGDENPEDNGVVEKWCYDDKESNCDEYGGLYRYEEAMNWQIVEGGRGICPEGWYIPTDDDWVSLTNFLGGEEVAGGKMKERGEEHWNPPNTGATNESEFTGFGAGYLWVFLESNIDHYYDLLKERTFFLSSSDDALNLWYGDRNAQLGIYYDYSGFSVRCIKKVE